MAPNETDTSSIRHIYRWDLDKTYLDTDLSLRNIWKVPFEGAAAKRNVPGAVVLLRELTYHEESQGRAHVVFISASPRQMRKTLEEKFRLDGLLPDQLYLKPNLHNFVTLRWRAIRDQVGYKLPLLLEARAEEEASVLETCFGDDSESDALIYSMYADLVAGEMGDFTLKELMQAAGAYPDAILRARDARRRIARAPSIRRIFVHLAMGSPPDRFVPYGSRVVPIRDYFQAALCLFGEGQLTAAGVVNVAHDMVFRYGFAPARLAESFQDILRRGFFDRTSSLSLAEGVKTVHFPAPLPSREETLKSLGSIIHAIPDNIGIPPTPTKIDYPSLIWAIRSRSREMRPASNVSDDEP